MFFMHKSYLFFLFKKVYILGQFMRKAGIMLQIKIKNYNR
jgi:hypothetical protein